MNAHAGHYAVVAIGCSAGGLAALKVVLGDLAPDFPGAVLVTFHIAPGRSHMRELLGAVCDLPVLDVEEKMHIEPGRVYLSCPDYHMLVEDNKTLALSIDAKVCNVRPAVDLTFKSAAAVYRSELVGVVLTGANHDGAAGLKVIRDLGGLAIVQDPKSAEAETMPRSALERAGADFVLPLEQIAPCLNRVFQEEPAPA